MPKRLVSKKIINFDCGVCGHDYTIIVKASEQSQIQCPICGGTPREISEREYYGPLAPYVYSVNWPIFMSTHILNSTNTANNITQYLGGETLAQSLFSAND